MSKKPYPSYCIQLKKKICNPEVVEMIKILGKQWFLENDNDVVIRIVNERVAKEQIKKKEIEEIRKLNNQYPR